MTERQKYKKEKRVQIDRQVYFNDSIDGTNLYISRFLTRLCTDLFEKTNDDSDGGGGRYDGQIVHQHDPELIHGVAYYIMHNGYVHEIERRGDVSGDVVDVCLVCIVERPISILVFGIARVPGS